MKKYILIVIIGIVSSSCSDFMDVIPDNIATIENIFSNRAQAEQNLFTCYVRLPQFGTSFEPGMSCGDISWFHLDVNGVAQPSWDLMRMGNNASSPLFNFWGAYVGIRNCNVFMENIDQVPDMDSYEKARWKAEVKFIKAFLHFWLFQMYGPIPIVRENLPISATPEEVAVYRDPVDDVVDYIVQLIDEAVPALPLTINNEVSELGRITQPIALAVKAKVLVTAASPLFNGNTAYAQLKDNRGRVLFDQDVSEDAKRRKWERAAIACKNAIDTCLLAGHQLYEFTTTLALSDTTRKVVQCSQIVTDRWNQEHIWGKSPSVFIRTYNIHMVTMPRLAAAHELALQQFLSPTLKMAEMFYSKNGVPIDEDKDFDYEGRYSTDTLEQDDTYHKYLLQPGRTTAKLHQNREFRFYGSLGVDGGWWFGVGRNDENAQWPLNFKLGQMEGGRMGTSYVVTGFYIKKLASYLTTYNNTSMVQRTYDWPIFRLADLYLLYAEAINEVEGPDGSRRDELFYYIDEVRKRAGLKGVEESWKEHTHPQYANRYTTQSGMRSIIQQERNIELAFEGHRFWDLRRWGLASEYFRQPIQGWNIGGTTDEEFYNVVTLSKVNYSLRDILWPIQESELQRNLNLVQNPGW